MPPSLDKAYKFVDRALEAVREVETYISNLVYGENGLRPAYAGADNFCRESSDNGLVRDVDDLVVLGTRIKMPKIPGTKREKIREQREANGKKAGGHLWKGRWKH